MKLDSTLLSRLALIGLLAAAPAGCGGSEPSAVEPGPGAAAGASAAATTAPAPTEERLVERVRAMWAKKTAAQWVEVYEFLAPPMRKAVPITRFLGGKEYHLYENAVVHEVMTLAKDGAHVRVSMRWTPSHPQLSKVQLEPGQTLTQDVETVETWRWTDGDWYFVEAKSIEEFVEQNPDVLKKGAQPPAGGESPKGAAAPAPKADDVADGNQPK